MEYVKVTLRGVDSTIGDERPFCAEHVFDAQVRVYEDGALAVWDSAGRLYSSSLADRLSAEQRAEVKRLAAIQWAIPADLRRSIHD